MNHWQYFSPQFDYENTLNPFETGWAGHVFFAYDLVRTFSPQNIVELGTHRGHSFFAFCQAVHDGKIDADLYAIDTWKGDPQAGFYNEDVFKEVQNIKHKYYGALKIMLVRKTFDDALFYFKDGSIDMLHIDGLHTYEAVKHDFHSWFGKVKETGIILFHDISEKRDDFGVWQLWEELKEKYKTLEFSHSHGLGILFKNTDKSLPIFNFQEIWQRYYPLVADNKSLQQQFQQTKKELSILLEDSHEKNIILEKKEQAIQSLSQVVQEKEKDVLIFNNTIQQQEQLVFQKGQEINNLTNRIQSQQQVIGNLNQGIVQKEQTIHALYQSWSWKITWPLRMLLKIPMKVFQVGTRFIKDVPYAIDLLKREGWKSFFSRCWLYIKGQRVISLDGYSKWISLYDTVTSSDRILMGNNIKQFSHKPLISIVMPVYNPNPQWLREAIDSISNQIYPHWELCIADDASTDKAIRSILGQYVKKDARIKVIHREKNGHISVASNSALEIATGEWVALLDHDDILSEHALYWLVNSIHQNPHARLIYSDEDKIDEYGKRFDPYFKCDWNVDLFYSHNMLSHLGVYHAGLLREIGGFRVGLEGSQDYDLALRCIEHVKSDQIIHIPRILYHWRMHKESTAQSPDAKPYAMIAGEKALNEYFQRQDIKAVVTFEGYGYRVHYTLPHTNPLVSLIIPTRNGLQFIQRCIESIFEKTTYSNYEIFVINNGSDDKRTVQYLQKLQSNTRIRYIRDDRPFNYSALNNVAVSKASGRLIGLLNNDLEIISPDWLSEMVSIALQPGVGAVGCRLLYPNNTLQHGGIILGMGGIAGHSHKYLEQGQYGYFGRARLIQSFSAVTGACLIIKKEIYEGVGGLNETDLAVAFNDVDFCLRVRSAGYRNVWTPYAELYHHESATRGTEDTIEKQERFKKEIAYMKKTWGDLLLHDPAYNPNLTLDHEDFSLAWPPRNK